MATTRMWLSVHPYIGALFTGAPSQVNKVLSASDSGLAWIFQAPQAGDITGGTIKVASREGSTGSYTFSLQAISTSTAYPTGTILGGGSPASTTFIPQSFANSLHEFSFDNAYTVARGEFVALVCLPDTIDASNYSTLGAHWNVGFVNYCAMPRTVHMTGGSWGEYGYAPLAQLSYASDVIGGVFTYYRIGLYKPSASPNEYALKFRMPTGVCNTYQVAAIHPGWYITGPNRIRLYNMAGDVLQEVTPDYDARVTSGSPLIRQDVVAFDEATLATLDAGTWYRLAFYCTTENDCYFPNVLSEWASQAAGAFGGPGNMFQVSSRTDSGSWTDDDTQGVQMSLLVQAMA